MSTRPAHYERPPVVERVASVYTEMPTEIFEARLGDWEELVKPEFPHFEPLKEWLILVEEKEDVPIFDTMRPELRITPRFSRKKSHEGFDWSIRCPAGQFTMNMHSRPEQGSERRYPHLRDQMATWLPRWMQHFSVSSTKRISLHYLNVLNARTIPSFATADGLLLNKVLAVFAHIPGDHECLIPPFDCKATVKLAGHENATLRIQVKDGTQSPRDPAVRVDIIVDVYPDPERTAMASDVLALLDWGHERILERFEVIFTDQAKASFGPVSA